MKLEMLDNAIQEQIRDGNHPRLRGNISSDLRGDISGLRGDISSDLRGDIAKGKYPGLSVPVADKDEVERLDAVREIVLATPERLTMNLWHSAEWTPKHTPHEERTCKSTHCVAGWLQALSSDPLIRKMEPEEAGERLAPASAHLFYANERRVLLWFKNREYAVSK